MDRLFRALRNPERARGTGAMVRRRLRSMVWKQWKPELRKRGIAAQEAASTAGSSDGPWHLAKHSHATTRSVERLLRLARPSRDYGPWLVQPVEPQDATATSAKPIMHARTGIGQEPVAIRRIAANRNRLENRKRTGFL